MYTSRSNFTYFSFVNGDRQQDRILSLQYFNNHTETKNLIKTVNQLVYQ